MRIIRGIYGRRRFALPSSLRARPTTDMAKEGLFNLLDNRLDWSEVATLDLFAGTGSIGLEALSRGSHRVVAVEAEAVHCTFIRQVLTKLGAPRAYRLIKGDAFKYLDAQRHVSQRGFDLIFADPPYDLPTLPTLPGTILSSGLLAPAGLLVVEHPRTIDLSDQPLYRFTRHYGSVHFSFFYEEGASDDNR